MKGEPHKETAMLIDPPPTVSPYRERILRERVLRHSPLSPP